MTSGVGTVGGARMANGMHCVAWCARSRADAVSAPARVVDLSLPDYATLVARAGVNPDAEAARVGSADPGVVSAAGGALGRAGGEFDTAWAQSQNAALDAGWCVRQ